MKRRFYVGVLLILILFPVKTISEQMYHITKMIVIPQKFYVGDLVELRVDFKIESGIELKAPEYLPESKWIKVEDVTYTSLTDGEMEVRIRLRSFQPGTHVIPTIPLGEIVFHDLKIHTSSILEVGDADKLRPLRGQMIIPHTWLRLSGFFLAVILFPILLYKIISRVYLSILSLRAERIKKLPFQRAKNGIGLLRKNIRRAEQRKFFIGISTVCRRYLEERLGISAQTSTTKELGSVLPVVLGEPHITAEIVSILDTSDSVKFGSRIIEMNKMEEILAKTMKIVQDIETEKCGVES